jgi:hypothetical protein
MLERFTPIARTKPVNRRRPGPKRKGLIRLPDYRAWLNQQPCLACIELRRRALDNEELPPPLPMFSHASHTENNGLSSKGADTSCVSLCPQHHTEYDRNRITFELKYDLVMKQQAAALYARFREEYPEP